MATDASEYVIGVCLKGVQKSRLSDHRTDQRAGSSDETGLLPVDHFPEGPFEIVGKDVAQDDGDFQMKRLDV